MLAILKISLFFIAEKKSMEKIIGKYIETKSIDKFVSKLLSLSLNICLESLVHMRIVCAPKIAFISLSINLSMCFGYSKEPSH